MKLRAAIGVAAVTGFISLSYEIMWFRVFSYETGSSPVTFGLLLGVYLGGLAVGADIGGKISRRSIPLVSTSLLACIAGYVVIPAMALSATHTPLWWLSLVSVAVAAGLSGAMLPMISHSGIEPGERTGEEMSYVYFANIVGAVVGSLLTGFVLTDFWGVEAIVLFLVSVGVALTAVLIIGQGRKRSAVQWALLGVVGAVLVFATPSLFDRLYEKLQFKDTYSGQKFVHLIENRHGIIAVTDSGVTFGGGAYDGHISTSLTDDRNGIERAYAITALSPHPRRILMVGLSTGAWAQVIANSPDVESLTVIEINPGYLDLIKVYSQVANLLTNPKVKIVIDDGRRWLVHNPDEKFDMVVSNTTFHYRSNTTNLLSTEFIRIVRAHLLPGGIYYFNTTGSQDAMKTAFTGFAHGLRLLNFVAVSDSPVSLDSARWHNVLTSYRIGGREVLDLTRAADETRFAVLDNLPQTIRTEPSARGLETRESVLARIPQARVVTDDNMLPEWHSLVLESGRDSTTMPRAK